MTDYKIYNINGMSEQEYDRYFSLMTPEKRERISRFRFEQDRKRTVAGEMLARQMLAAYSGIEEAALTFAIGEHGKPFVKNIQLMFNISHSGNLVLCAVSDRQIGVDIEKIRPVEERLIRYVCCDDEYRYVTEPDISPQEQQRRFFHVWTFKEAFFKCDGKGLGNFKNCNLFTPELLKRSKTFFYENYAVAYVWAE